MHAIHHRLAETSSLARISRESSPSRVVVIGLAALLTGWGIAPVAAQEKAKKPTLIEQVVQGIFSKVNGTVSVDKADLNFAAPVVLHGLSFKDLKGNEVLSLEKMEFKKTLPALLLDLSNPGPPKCTGAKAFVMIDENGCNFINVFAAWYIDRQKKKRDNQFEILGAHVHVIDALRGKQWILNPVNASLLRDKENKEVKRFTASATADQYGLQFACEAAYDADAGRLELSNLDVNSERTKLGFTGKGSLDQIKTSPVFQLEGRWKYDLELLTQKLREATGMDVVLRGQGDQPIRVVARLNPLPLNLDRLNLDRLNPLQQNPAQQTPGPPPSPEEAKAPADGVRLAGLSVPAELQPPRLSRKEADPNAESPFQPSGLWALVNHVTVDTQIRWDYAKMGGFQIGPGETPIQLKDGWILTPPMRFPCNGGSVQFAPGIYLANGRPELILEPGLLATHIRITPEMCRRALKYVAPILADVTVAEGLFSIELDHFRMPLGDFSQGEMQGRFLVHAIDVGPSPMVRGIASLLRVPPRVAFLRDSAVAFQLKNARMYHQGLAFVLGGT
ncbi:MAG: hypothetical protein N2C14_02105, partial [Planctomycetales bacterium]